MHMNSAANKIVVFLLGLLMTLALLCSCGSDLDGTWRSQKDPDTKIKFSGSKVRVTYGSFRIDGTWETDEEGHIVMTLTDKNGDKYKIVANVTDKDSSHLSLTNPDGEKEVFKK